MCFWRTSVNHKLHRWKSFSFGALSSAWHTIGGLANINIYWTNECAYLPLGCLSEDLLWGLHYIGVICCCDKGHRYVRCLWIMLKLESEKQGGSLEQMGVTSVFGFLLCITVSVVIISDCALWSLHLLKVFQRETIYLKMCEQHCRL